MAKTAPQDLKFLPKRAVFLRHGKALPAVDNDDQNRPLSEVGIAQANTRAASFKRIEFVGGLSSTAERCYHTGRLAYGFDLDQAPELYLGVNPYDQKSGEMQFALMLYASLREYITEDRTGWLFRYGRDAVGAIKHVYNTKPSYVRTGGYWAVAGHAVFCNLMAMLMFPDHADEIQDICLGEAEALVISPEHGLQYITGDAIAKV